MHKMSGVISSFQLFWTAATWKINKIQNISNVDVFVPNSAEARETSFEKKLQ